LLRLKLLSTSLALALLCWAPSPQAAPPTTAPASPKLTPKASPAAPPSKGTNKVKSSPDKIAATDSQLRIKAIGFLGLGPLLGVGKADVAYRRTYKRSKNKLLDGLYGQVGGGVTLSPALVGLKVEAEWLPLAILRLRASYSALLYTGLPMGLGHGLNFAGADAAFDGVTLKARKGEEQLHLSHRAVLTLTLRAKLGPVIILNDAELAGWYMPELDGPGYGYGTYYDTLIKRGTLDGTFMNQTMLLFEVWDPPGDANMRIGFIHEYVRAFDTGRERSRLGLLILLTPWHKAIGINAPMLVLAPGITLMDTNRKHEFWAKLALVFNWYK
jgi:hypothetical protein